MCSQNVWFNTAKTKTEKFKYQKPDIRRRIHYTHCYLMPTIDSASKKPLNLSFLQSVSEVLSSRHIKLASGEN